MPVWYDLLMGKQKGFIIDAISVARGIYLRGEDLQMWLTAVAEKHDANGHGDIAKAVRSIRDDIRGLSS